MTASGLPFIDPGGIRHSVEVQADSMYEAAAAGLENFTGTTARREGAGAGSESADCGHPHAQRQETGRLGESRWRITAGHDPETKD